MDGNGRWAEEHDLPRVEGHKAGAKQVVNLIRSLKNTEVKYVTLYAFSTENWSRSEDEVSALMDLLCEFLDHYVDEFIENKVRLLVSGRKERIPEKCRIRIESVVSRTAENYDRTIIIAFNYGGRQEIVDAVRKITEQITADQISVNDISEKTIAENLYHPDVPDPDLMVRTSGELRISNFLLWELSYSEFYFTDTYWPDFDEKELKKAIESYYHRKRRFGGRK